MFENEEIIDDKKNYQNEEEENIIIKNHKNNNIIDFDENIEDKNNYENTKKSTKEKLDKNIVQKLLDQMEFLTNGQNSLEKRNEQYMQYLRDKFEEEKEINDKVFYPSLELENNEKKKLKYKDKEINEGQYNKKNELKEVHMNNKEIIFPEKQNGLKEMIINKENMNEKEKIKETDMNIDDNKKQKIIKEKNINKKIDKGCEEQKIYDKKKEEKGLSDETSIYSLISNIFYHKYDFGIKIKDNKIGFGALSSLFISVYIYY